MLNLLQKCTVKLVRADCVPPKSPTVSPHKNLANCSVKLVGESREAPVGFHLFQRKNS